MWRKWSEDLNVLPAVDTNHIGRLRVSHPDKQRLILDKLRLRNVGVSFLLPSLHDLHEIASDGTPIRGWFNPFKLSKIEAS
jgi:hypothetical protein